PRGVAADSRGNVWISSTHTSAGKDYLLLVTCSPEGFVTAVVSGIEVASEWGSFVIDGSGYAYYLHGQGDSVVVSSADGVAYDSAVSKSSGMMGFSGDDGPARDAQLNWARGLAVDREGNLYIADTDNNRVRVVAHAWLGFATSLRVTGPCAAPPVVNAGEKTPVEFSWTLVCDGPHVADSFPVTVTLPAGAEIVSTSDSMDARRDGTTVTWRVSIPVGMSKTFSVSAKVSGAAGDSLVAHLTAETGQPDTAGQRVRVAHPLTVRAQAAGDVSVVDRGALPSTVPAGVTTGKVQFSWDVQRAGGSSVQGVAVTATLPATVKETACDPKPDSSNGGVLTWNLTGGTTQHFTLTADVTPGQKDPDARVRVVTRPQQGADAWADLVVRTSVPGAVAVKNTAVYPSSVAAGVTTGKVQFSWDVQRAGGSSLQGVAVTATLPATVKETACDPKPDSSNGGVLTWNLTGGT
ncbi:hypothetical protein M4438_37525, partial [Streptomyces lavenduligriseus]|nr:hypothetical protein [Streptomyces lavenduligriseus]